MVLKIKIKRVYENPSKKDGIRILVDRLWPRGMTKNDAAISIWAKEISPSPTLRKWFNHEEKNFGIFRIAYCEELDDKKEILSEILSKGNSTITLVYAAKNPKINHAICLKEYIEKNFSK